MCFTPVVFDMAAVQLQWQYQRRQLHSERAGLEMEIWGVVILCVVRDAVLSEDPESECGEKEKEV